MRLSHFTDKGSEVQRGQTTCPRSQSSQRLSCIHSRLPGLEPTFLFIHCTSRLLPMAVPSPPSPRSEEDSCPKTLGHHLKCFPCTLLSIHCGGNSPLLSIMDLLWGCWVPLAERSWDHHSLGLLRPLDQQKGSR
jgi:hypothetical protein